MRRKLSWWGGMALMALLPACGSDVAPHDGGGGAGWVGAAGGGAGRPQKGEAGTAGKGTSGGGGAGGVSTRDAGTAGADAAARDARGDGSSDASGRDAVVRHDGGLLGEAGDRRDARDDVAADGAPEVDATTSADGGTSDVIEFVACDATAATPLPATISFSNPTLIKLALSSTAVLQALVVTDTDGDGSPDIAISTKPSGAPPWAGAVRVALGDGKGSFSTPSTVWSGDPVGTLAAADLTGDGHPELVVAEDERHLSGQLWYALVLDNDGLGGFQVGPSYEERTYNLTTLLPGDFNRDGLADLLVNGAGLSVRLSGGDSLGDELKVPSVVASSVATGHFNHDRHLDLAYVAAGDPMSGAPGSVGVLYGRGDGTFKMGPSGHLAKYGEYGANAMVTADFDRDGIDEIALIVTNTSSMAELTVFSFALGCVTGIDTTIKLDAGIPVQIAADDVDGDGLPDIVVVLETSALVFRGRGDASFFDPVSFPTGGGATIGPGTIVLRDINKDGLPDLIVDSLAASSGQPDTVTLLVNASSP